MLWKIAEPIARFRFTKAWFKASICSVGIIAGPMKDPDDASTCLIWIRIKSSPTAYEVIPVAKPMG